MATVLEALDELAAEKWQRHWHHPAIRRFLTTGDSEELAKIPARAFKDKAFPSALLEALHCSIDKPGDHEMRLLRLCVEKELTSAIGDWLISVNAEKPDCFDAAVRALRSMGASDLFLASALGRWTHSGGRRDSPAGRFLLGLSKDVLVEWIESGKLEFEAKGLREFLSGNAPETMASALSAVLAAGRMKKFPFGVLTEFLGANPGKFATLAERALEQCTENSYHFALLQHLTNIDPHKYGLVVDRIASSLLPGASPWHTEKEIAEWLIQNRAGTSTGTLKRYFASPLGADPWRRKYGSEYKNEALDTAAKHLGANAIPCYEACFETSQPEVQLRALQHWIALSRAADVKAIAGRFRQLLAAEDSSAVSRATRQAGEWNPQELEAELWQLLSHKSRPAREAAAAALAKLGDSRLSKAPELWKAKKADTRMATASWLKAVGSPAAAGELKSRLGLEEDEDVRDALLLAIERLTGAAEAMDPTELKRRIKNTVEKLDGPPVRWLDPKKLPLPRLKNGRKLDADGLLYLLYRQSRVKDMRADIEARPLFAQIDRKTSGDLALAVLQAFFGSKADADHRWTMAFAAIAGDDRLVPVFTRQIKDWADNMRGKLAEYAVQALALLGTDSALLAVDAMAIRYRSKNKNIGKAASEAFAKAAQARGLTVEELGDLVVPWLGFQPGKPRVVEAGKAKIESLVGNDFKLTFRDVTTNKKVAKLPDSAPAAVKTEFKELSAGLKEAVKSQLLRMETLMVRQFRWPVARWKELYLEHPLLLPFAQRLVWGDYDRAGKLAGTFRTLEDRSLTDAADESCTLPNDCGIGIVHPLELAPETRQGWLKHLADYDVIPPFAQLERPVVKVKPEQKGTKFGSEVAETELNAMTFKGRAERLGWTRGSVCDAGGISFYLKSFPAAGVDVFVGTDGLYVGIDMYSDITLGKAFFVKHSSVQIGSYVYDEPGDTNDPRLVAYGVVPPIAFSEAMGDLVKIAGKESGPSPDSE